MLVNSVIIVLREVLEATLMISVLLAVSRPLQLASRWLAAGLALGLVGAAAYGYFLGPVSNLFDGVGQELVNALLQFGTYAALLLIVFLIARQGSQPYRNSRVLPTAMSTAIALAAAREGSEILVFVTGFLHMDNFMPSVGLGSFAGAAIGCSIGVLFYYFLLAMPVRRTLRIALALLALAAAGMSAQATRLLIQADWISVAGPLWDSSGFIAEDSLPGQLLYALVGYEATPSATEALVYTASIALMALSIFLGFRAAGQVPTRVQ
ncbi:MAG: FTR1 family protein [Gammaproteobacteria bacterium]|nr:FTR1 family protein [Gammaproteobacteria bacterium]MDH5303736.1 FTR1 family protein [Gammaproteobacteria bacterium]MDH5322986.1 FTR1 family protein [Gammaproteobacteria bacterium]